MVGIMIFRLLPLLLAIFGCYTVSHELAVRRKIYPDWRIVWIFASIIWGVILTLIIELSSAIHLLNPFVIAASWFVCALYLVSLSAWFAYRRGVLPTVTLQQKYQQLRVFIFQRVGYDALLMFVCIGILILVLGAIAVITPTTNWDSMTYHMTRVMHWMQQQSVDSYFTLNTRQLESGPWAEFAITTLYLLWGNDQLSNAVQWFAMLGSVIVTSLLVQQLLVRRNEDGGKKSFFDTKTQFRAMALACVMLATLPIGMFESITTQNDYVTTYWLMCLVAMSLAFIREPDNIYYVVGMALSFSLGVLTKPTMLIFAAPILVAVGFLMLRFFVRARFIQICLVFFLSFMLLNSFHMLRNYYLFGMPLGSEDTFKMQRNMLFSPASTASNVIRNISLQTHTGFSLIDDQVDGFITLLHSFTGLSVNDERLTFPFVDFKFQDVDKVNTEDDVSNPVHLLLFFLSIALLPFLESDLRRKSFIYASLVIMGFLLFCSYLRWQPWHTRFHLAYFAAFIPVIAIAFAKLFPRWVIILMAMGLFYNAYINIGSNSNRPINVRGDFLDLPREQQYFVAREDLYVSYRAVADDIIASECQYIGLRLDFDDWEYPLWVLLRDRGFKGQINSIYVPGDSVKIASQLPHPCAIITTFRDTPLEIKSSYPYVSEHAPISIYWSSPQRIQLDARIQNPNGLERLDGMPFFWIGQGSTIVSVQTPYTGTLTLQAQFILGPSLPGVKSRKLLVAVSGGYKQEVNIGQGESTIRIPAPAGQVQVELIPLDKSTIAITGNNDTRPLLLGVKGLKVILQQ